jgi:hypothetical protein
MSFDIDDVGAEGSIVVESNTPPTFIRMVLPFIVNVTGIHCPFDPLTSTVPKIFLPLSNR